MREVVGNLWDYPADVRIITTNGTINSKGECVMGRGCAKEAKDRYNTLATHLGEAIKKEGNHPYSFQLYRMYGEKWTLDEIISFPVKHNWYELADLNLIRTSALQLARMLDPNKIYVMPRPGCGNGRRTWEEVKPLIDFLPDNVHVITWEKPNGTS